MKDWRRMDVVYSACVTCTSDVSRFEFERREKEMKFFIVFCSLPGMAGDLKSRPFRPIGPSHFHVAWQGFYRLFAFRSHLCPTICEAVLLGFENWCVFIHSDLYLKWKKIYSPKIVLVYNLVSMSWVLAATRGNCVVTGTLVLMGFFKYQEHPGSDDLAV